MNVRIRIAMNVFSQRLLHRLTVRKSYGRCYSLVEALEIISRNRHAEKSFSQKDVPSATIRKIVELTQLAPSSFNLQPYKIILIKSDEMKDMVAEAMSPGNVRHVKNAAYTAVFAADKEPGRSTRKLMDLEAAHGAHPAYVSSLPSKITLLLGSGAVSKRIRKLGSHLLSPLSPSPVVNTSNEAWAVKNTAFAAQQFMLAATACGLRTLPMEGFDERRLAAILDMSTDDYTVPVVICLGHSTEEKDELPGVMEKCAEHSYGKSIANTSVDLPKKVRFPIEDMCFSEKFGQKPDFL